MANVTQQKRFTKKVCLSDNKLGYNNKINYILYLKEYTDISFVYNKNEKTNIINDGKLNFIDIINILKKVSVFKSGDINTKEVEKAINELCKENTIFTSKEELKNIQLERDKKKLENYLIETYNDSFSLQVPSNTIYFNGKLLSKDMIQTIIINAKTKLSLILKDKDIKAIISNIAAKQTFEKQVISVDNSLNNENINGDNYFEYFDTDKNGEPKNTINNYALFLQYGSKYRNRLAMNLFDKNPYILVNDKWEYRNPETHDSQIYLDLEQSFPSCSINRKNGEDAIRIVQNKNSFHPIVEKLNKLRGTWDGTKRLETFFIDKLEADDTRLNRNMTKKWFVASIKRILEEGKSAEDCVHFDYMLILFGGQGSGKSKIWGKIFGEQYVDSSVDIRNEQSAVDKLNKSWVVVFDELASFKKADMDSIKDFISTTSHTTRLSYDKRATFYPVHNVFCGSTNEQYFLRDNSDRIERRFWVIDVHSKGHPKEWWDENFDEYYRQQLLAETIYIYDNDKDFSLQLDDEDTQSLIEVQNEHKTWKMNTVNNEQIEELLNSNFTKEVFDNYEDFSTSLMDSTSIGKGYKINILRGSFIVQYLKSKGIATLCATQLKPVMSDLGWTYIKYRRKQIPEYNEKYVFVKDEYIIDDIPLHNNQGEFEDKLPF